MKAADDIIIVRPCDFENMLQLVYNRNWGSQTVRRFEGKIQFRLVLRILMVYPCKVA